MTILKQIKKVLGSLSLKEETNRRIEDINYNFTVITNKLNELEKKLEEK